MEYEKLLTQRAELASAPELWQFDLLSPQEFCRFSTDRDIPIFSAEKVSHLWRIGLLRADLITTRSELEIPSVKLLSRSNGVLTYCDRKEKGDAPLYRSKVFRLNAEIRDSSVFCLVSRVNPWGQTPLKEAAAQRVRSEGEMLKLRDIDHVVLRVRDIEAMTRFYCDVLGASKVAYRPEFGMTHL